MNNEQIAEELRSLADDSERRQIVLDELIDTLRHVQERSIPSAVADVVHTQTGILKLVADQAGTVQSLATQLHSLSDRLTLLEQVIDLGPDIGLN